MTVKIERYIAVLSVAPGTNEEATRDTTFIHAVDDVDAVQKAEEWARERAVDGDVLQIVKDGRGIKSIPLRVVR
jgi:hypothetical protein